MYTSFEKLPPDARVWIYTARPSLNELQIKIITEKLIAFCEQWQSHQKDVLASFIILESRFIVIAVDESTNDISGCGIDKSLHTIQELEQLVGISLTEKSFLLFEKNGILEIPVGKMKQAVLDGTIKETDSYFNTLATTAAEVQGNFKVLVKDSWLKKYFPVTA